MVNGMLESVVTYTDTDLPNGQKTRIRSITLSPGVRGGWNLKGEKQIVIGAAVPFTRADGDGTAALLTYFSYELPFR